jgi:hypothetical protein
MLTVGLASIVDNMVVQFKPNDLRLLYGCQDMDFNTKFSRPDDALSVLTIVQVSHFLDSGKVIFGTWPTV